MAKFKITWDLHSNTKSELFIFLPINDGNQEINSIRLSKESTITNNKYYSYAKFRTNNNFTISADINIKLRRITSFKDNDYEPFLKRTPSLLMNKTRKLVKGLKSPRMIYEWIINNIKPTDDISIYYKDLLEPNIIDLERAIIHKKAMCGGKSALFVSMCRNIGIPSRVVTGYFLRDGWAYLKNAEPHDNFLDIHAWAEYYENNYWHPVDINIAQQTNNDYFNEFPDKLFGNKDRRVIISKGSEFIIGKNKLDYLQTGYYTKGNNLKISLKIKQSS